MLKLIIGNKRYSSWSMRPWLLLRVFRIPFEEIVVPLYRGDSKPMLLEHSPAGKVPIVRDGELAVWESLAIIDYIAELNPNLAIWPRERVFRAQARALSCEIHAGFSALRSQCSMNFGRSPRALALTDASRADVARIDAAWRDALSHAGGPFLFGDFGAVDAMFAPVVQRFEAYMIDVSAPARKYMANIQSLEAWNDWREAASAERWRLPQFEAE